MIEPHAAFRTARMAFTAHARDAVANPLAPVKILYQTPLRLCTAMSSVVEDIRSLAQRSGDGQKKTN